MNRTTVNRWIGVFLALTALCGLGWAVLIALDIFAAAHEVPWLTPPIHGLILVALATLTVIFTSELGDLIKYRALTGVQNEILAAVQKAAEPTEPLIRHPAPHQFHHPPMLHPVPSLPVPPQPVQIIRAAVRPSLPEPETTAELALPADLPSPTAATALAERPHRSTGRGTTRIVRASDEDAHEQQPPTPAEIMQAYLQGKAEGEREARERAAYPDDAPGMEGETPVA